MSDGELRERVGRSERAYRFIGREIPLTASNIVVEQRLDRSVPNRNTQKVEREFEELDNISVSPSQIEASTDLFQDM